MKRVFLICCSLFAIVLFCSKSCDRSEEETMRREEERFQATTDSIAGLLEKDVPTEQTLRALEIKAKEKLADFRDYLELYRGLAADDPFRQHTAKMIRELFVSDTVLINTGTPEQGIGRVQSLKELLENDPGKDAATAGFAFDSLYVDEPLAIDESGIYMGCLGFVQQFENTSGQTKFVVSEDRKIDIVAARITKHFGKDSLTVWQVFLAGIR